MPETEAPVEPGAASPGAQWPAQATDRVVGLVDALAQRTSVRVDKLVRLIVYGAVAAAAGAAMALFLTLAVFRIWDTYVPIDPVGRRVWLGYVILGGLFLLVGMFAWHKRARQRA